MAKKMLFQFITIVGILVTILMIKNLIFNITASDIQTTVLSFGWMAPFVFIILYTIRPFVFFPASIMAIAGGLAFGPIVGSIAGYIGSLSGAALSFIASRKINMVFVDHKWKSDKWNKFQRKIDKEGFTLILVMRVLPIINFDFVSYVSGMSGVRFHKYMFGTMIGIIPGTLAYNFMGASIVHMDLRMILLTCFIFLFILLIPVFLRKKLNERDMMLDLFTDNKKI